jgi:hypothetical protein
MFALVVAVVLLLEGASPTPEVVTEKLTCVDDVDSRVVNADARPDEELLLWRSSVTFHVRRLENLDVFSDGHVVLSIGYREAGLMRCRARLTTERVVSLRRDLERTKVWLVRRSKDVSGDSEALGIRLDRKRRGSAEFTPERWARLPATRAVQRIVDQLKAEVCGGRCPEPRNRTPWYDLIPLPVGEVK